MMNKDVHAKTPLANYFTPVRTYRLTNHQD